MYKIISVILLCLTLFSSSSTSAKTATGTMMVTVTVDPNAVSIPRKEPIMKDGKIGNTNQNTKVMENTNIDCCYCTKKYSDGSYIDEERNSYLFDRQTGTFAINRLNKDNRYAIRCPTPDWGKPKN